MVQYHGPTGGPRLSPIRPLDRPVRWRDMVDAAPELSPTTMPARTSIRHRIVQPVGQGPALIVLGIAVFIVVVGIGGSALDSGRRRPCPSTVSPLPTARSCTSPRPPRP